MKKNAFLICFVALSFAGFAQYKNDNVLFKTVYTQELCAALEQNPGSLFLDVRSPGEYMDTSARGSNLGRFKNSINIEAREMGKRISEISGYKDKPVFVYCSHSQRSRRASKMLADSGFKHVFNINAGMTGIRQMTPSENPCLYDKIETAVTYNIISATDLCNKINKEPGNIFLLDVRSDSAFRHISLDARTNAYGHFKNAVNIPLSKLETEISKVPANKEIFIIDIFGDEAEKAARLLKQKNYARVSILLEGLDRYIATNPDQVSCTGDMYISKLPYRIINAMSFKRFLDTKQPYQLLDVRTVDEFNNKSTNSWQNLGHIGNAINIPAAAVDNELIKLLAYKNLPLIVYALGSGKEAHETARKLVNNGFSNVSLLHGGIFNFGWTASNIKGYSSLAALRVNVPLENQ